MKKLIINIPCYNEEKTLPLVLNELPKKIKGVKIEVQIVDDGSTDNTVQVAKKYGCRILKHKQNKGLGIAFETGLKEALKRKCDVFVNTDADNQYPSRYIPDLIKPVLKGEADIVVGNRNPWKVKHFSILKRGLQWLGSFIVRKMTQLNVRDTVSGFRAYSREALLELNITSKFSYVLDTLMQASEKGLTVVNYDIEINKPTRKSRLFKNMFQHMKKSFANLTRVFYLYQPFKTFTILSGLFFIPGLFLVLRFFYFYFTGVGGHVQSLIIAAILIIASILMFGFAIIGDSIKANRKLLEELLYGKK